FSPDGHFVACGVMSRRGVGLPRAEVVIWDRAAGRVARSLRLDNGVVPKLTYSRDGCRLFGFMESNSKSEIVIWDLEGAGGPLRLPWHGLTLAGLIPSHDGRRFVTLSGSSF